MSLLIALLADETLDKEKLQEMNIIHDLGEIGIGDIKWESVKKDIKFVFAERLDEVLSVAMKKWPPVKEVKRAYPRPTYLAAN